MHYAALVTLVFLAACGSNDEVPGEPEFTFTCGCDFGDCLRQAKAACPNDYAVKALVESMDACRIIDRNNSITVIRCR